MLPLADLFTSDAIVIVLLLLADFVVPAAIGIVFRRWVVLGLVFVLWVALMLLAAAAGWLAGSDDVSTRGLIVASVVLILVPAEVVSAAAILLGRFIRRPDLHP